MLGRDGEVRASERGVDDSRYKWKVLSVVVFGICMVVLDAAAAG